MIDPDTRTLDTFGDASVSGELDRCVPAKWTRGVSGPDGCLYCAPLGAPSVLVIDPISRSLRMLGNFGKAQGKWNEGVLGPGGKIYCSPDCSRSVLVIDVSSGDARTFGELQEGRRKWTKGVLAPNGRIYCAPLCADSVLVIDPATETTWRIPVPGNSDGRFLWTQGVLGPDGKIYCSPLSASAVLVIEIDSDTVSTLGNFGFSRFKWNQGVLGPDGRIYCAPAMNREVGVLVVEPRGFRWTSAASPFFPHSFMRVLRLLLLIHQRGHATGSWGALPKYVLIDQIFPYFEKDWFAQTRDKA